MQMHSSFITQMGNPGVRPAVRHCMTVRAVIAPLRSRLCLVAAEVLPTPGGVLNLCIYRLYPDIIILTRRSRNQEG